MRVMLLGGGMRVMLLGAGMRVMLPGGVRVMLPVGHGQDTPPGQVPFPPLSLQDSRGLPTRGEKMPTRAQPLGCQQHAPHRWQRGQALGHSSGGLGAPTQDLGVPEPTPAATTATGYVTYCHISSPGE